MAAKKLMSFVTQEQADELKKERQEEWERVRKPEDPKEPPPEVYDARPLYERLKEQKDKAQEEHEEKFKFKNMIYKGLDDEEASFLNVIVDQQALQIRNMLNREKEEISIYRAEVSRLIDEQEHNRDVTTTEDTLPTSPNEQSAPHLKSQTKNVLAGMVVTRRKRKSSSRSSTDAVEDNTIEKKSKVADNKAATTKNSLLSLTAYSSSSDEDD